MMDMKKLENAIKEIEESAGYFSKIKDLTRSFEMVVQTFQSVTEAADEIKGKTERIEKALDDVKNENHTATDKIIQEFEITKTKVQDLHSVTEENNEQLRVLLDNSKKRQIAIIIIGVVMVILQGIALFVK